MLVHSPRYDTPLHEFGINKPFALDRGTRVVEKLKSEFGEKCIHIVEPEPLAMSDILLVHSAAYVETLSNPQTWLDVFELKADEYDANAAVRPLTELFDDIAFKSGGTKLAAELAFKHGMSANLGGGYHHAFPDRGHGFCVLNDVAIAIRSVQQQGLAKRCLVVDVDFHQGDGTAVIFKEDDSVFTFSIHSAEGWPDLKQRSDLDVEILSNQQDRYLDLFQNGLRMALDRSSPDFVLFVAGSDAYELDVLPGTKFIKLPLEQMQKRDQLVIETFAKSGTPLAMVFAGGYGPHVWEVHYWATKCIVEHITKCSYT